MKSLQITLEEDLLPSTKNSFKDLIFLMEENEAYSYKFDEERDKKYNSLKTRMFFKKAFIWKIWK